MEAGVGVLTRCLLFFRGKDWSVLTMFDQGLGDFCTIIAGELLSSNLCCLVLAQVELKHDVAGCTFGHACARSAAQFFSTALFLAILVLISLEPTEV